jgi:hypothetical protein
MAVKKLPLFDTLVMTAMDVHYSPKPHFEVIKETAKTTNRQIRALPPPP